MLCRQGADARSVKGKNQQLRYGIIADDLTGATDAAAGFANCGFQVAVALEPGRLRSLAAHVMVLSTHSRHDAPATSCRKVRKACAQLHAGGVTLLYKKIDSTVQGNIVAEVEAARDAGGFAAALVCPANPSQGRVVRGGVLRVRASDSVNLRHRFLIQGLTEFGSVESPISVAKVTHSIQQGRRFIIADATSERDLAFLVLAVLQSKFRVLLAGSAGMAGALAKLLSRRNSAQVNQSFKSPLTSAGKDACGKTLAFTGSNNPVTERQLKQLSAKTNAVSLALDGCTRKHAAVALANECNVIVRVPVHRRSNRIVIRQLNGLASLFRGRLVGSLLLTGGDTALLICRCLRPLAIAVNGEIVPGLAWGRFIGGIADGLSVCTKPGGFGVDQSLVRAVDFLAKASAEVPPSGIRVRSQRTCGTSQPHRVDSRAPETSRTTS